MNIFSKRGGVNKLATSFILASIMCVTPISHTGEVTKADAQVITGGIVVNDIGNTLTNTIQTLSAVALEQKELVLDGLFYSIAQKALQGMTNDIIKWINSGFDGEPAFITDLEGYLLDISDNVAGDFIYNGELNTLCEPFKIDVAVAVANQHVKETQGGFKEKARCSIDEPGVDVEAFLAGDFNAGGWGIFLETALNPENTPIGAYIEAEVVLDLKKTEAQDLAKEELSYNGGYKSIKVCSDGGRCTVTTPGSVIKSQLEFALQIPTLSLLNADEMNETVGALFGSIANQVIGGVNGLLGLGGNASFSNNTFGASGNVSYLDAVAQESIKNNQISAAGENKIRQALVTEIKVLELQFAIVKEINTSLALFDEAKKPFANDSCWSLEVPTKVQDTLDELTVKVPVTASAVAKLQDLSDKFDASTLASEQIQLYQQFTTLQTGGLISGQTAVIEYDFFLNSELKRILDTFKKDIISAEKSC